ncbi:CRISPR-associated endonuclease Cas6 [Haliscomenobacter hydrossis]|uniref:CRISPR-associated protein Cas6 n=1 Tax=Haliscomenobacter hydrossis (strain ATCC 27775 / DSM 1100 / LMG 10767 / O) TaxID=760192 RepID=F4L2K4_HALH1|nr:CRISPR-associated endonuclease Cas6 [Haliscomenobacter hydrossis]AEE53922.1 hypothetical protein Halhy_6100 [Haliscomenobacter hydrossis DSM 1100]
MPNPHQINTLLLTFRLPIYPHQIPSWRGAFIEMAGWEADLLHNHQAGADAQSFIYRYPLVQYRVRDGLASIFALNEGIEAVQQVLFSKKWEVNWRGRPMGLIIENQPERNSYTLQVGATRRYIVRKYLALNAENYAHWQACDGLIERAKLLERVLTGHLLSCMWGLGWQGSEQVQVRVQEIRKSGLVPYHQQQLMAFDLIFDANVDLPAGIAIGKAVSHGFGWMVPAPAAQANHHQDEIIAARPTLAQR